MLHIMRDVSQIAGVNEDSIWVYLCNLEPTDMVEYGLSCPSGTRRRTSLVREITAISERLSRWARDQ
jgi:hypothetical protein